MFYIDLGKTYGKLFRDLLWLILIKKLYSSYIDAIKMCMIQEVSLKSFLQP